MLLSVIFSVFVVLAVGSHDAYDRYKVYKVLPDTEEHLNVLKVMEVNVPGVDFWIHPSIMKKYGFVMVPPDGQEVFETMLSSSGIDYEINVPNVKRMLKDEDMGLMKFNKSNNTKNSRLSYDRYYRYDEINAYMDYLAETYPDKVSQGVAGTSVEGRSIKYLRISSDGFQDAHKPVIFVDGGIHAREWISPPVVTYILQQLVEDVTESELVDNIDWIIVPLLNPDGYEWTHTNQRLWRKNRSTGNGLTCVGVDLNRNFDFKWMVAGASQSCASETYAGPSPLSEPEAETLHRLLIEHRSRTKLYLTFHSYGSYILYPWGYNSGIELPSNADNMQKIGQMAADAIKSEEYVVGNSATLLYAAAGASDDYAKYLGVPLSYTIELPGNKNGFEYGFQLPTTEIEQVVKETWDGVVVFARETLTRHRNGEL